jgi:uncharacterized protein YccT (UPF0319 family)
MNDEPQEQPSAPPVPEGTADPTPPSASREDQLFQAASQDVQIESEPSPVPMPVVPHKKSKKKVALIVLIVLVLLAGIGAAAFALTRPKTEETSQINEPAAEAPAAPTFEPKSVAYSFRTKDSEPVTLYTRPVLDGERTEVQKLTRDTIITQSDTQDAQVAIVADEDIMLSTDHGETYTKIFESEPGAQVTSVKLDAEGTGLAFGYLKEAAGKNELRTIDLKGENSQTVLTTPEAGLFIEGWSSKNKRVVYQVGCYNCDGRRATVYSFDTGTEKRTTLLEGVTTNEIVSLAVSRDTALLLYVTGNFVDQADVLGGTNVAPYNVNLLTIASNEDKAIATVGTAGEKNTNGTPKVRSFVTGFGAGTNTPYYTVDNQLFLVREGEGLLYLEVDKKILGVDYVSDKTIISRYGDDNTDFTMANYEVQAKKSTVIMEGDGNTRIFGVTTD